MVDYSFYENIWKITLWKKVVISLFLFLFFGFLIYLLTESLDSGYPLFLLFLPLIVTSGFYVERWNILPSIFTTFSLLFLSIVHYGHEFFEFWYISILNLAIFLIIFSVVSILIGNVNVAFEKLRDEKEDEVNNRKRAERRKDLLYTLLRQDLQSKYQIIQGYLQLMEGSELTEKQEKFLKRALEKGRETGEILEMIKNLEQIEDIKLSDEKEVFYVLEDVVEHVSDLTGRENVKLEKNYNESLGRVEKSYSLRTLFLKILETQIELSQCDRIEISCEQEEKGFVVMIEDDGKKLSKSIRELFYGKIYEGKTAGEGGLRYYIIQEIANQSDAEIQIRDSKLGGSKFEIRIPRAKMS